METKFEQLQMVLDNMGFELTVEEITIETGENIQEHLEGRLEEMREYMAHGEIPIILAEMDIQREFYTALDTLHHLLDDLRQKEFEDTPVPDEDAEKPMSVDALLADYGRWVGTCVLKAASPGQLTAKEYIDEFCSFAWTLTSVEVREFLLQFYTPEDAEYWMEQRMWRDDPDAGAITIVREVE